jgi:UDP-glucuronate decarboxylase
MKNYSVLTCSLFKLLKVKPITLYGDGLQARSFCYVDDMMESVARLMNSPDDFSLAR